MTIVTFAISQSLNSFKQSLKSQLKELSQMLGVYPILEKFYYYLHGASWTLDGEDNTLDIQNLEGFCTLQNVKIEIHGHHNRVVIASGVHLRNTNIIVKGSHHHLYIGARCQILGGCLWMSDTSGNLTIQADTTITNANIGLSESNKSITIGRDCMLAHGIEIRTGDSHAILDRKTRQRINPGASIVIGDHVWIGAHARILKGVNIGAHSVIGMGALVTKSIPEHVIAVGIPAKPKRLDIDWTRENLPISE